MSTGLAVGAALAAATAYGGASAAQHAAAARQAGAALDPRALLRLLRSGLWLLSFAGEGVAVVLQGVGLAAGSVALVQALLVVQLPVAVLGSRLLGAARLDGRARLGLLLTTSGTALLAAAVPVPPVPTGVPPAGRSLLGLALLVATVAVLLAGAALRARSVLTGAAAGVVVGAAAVPLALCSRGVAHPVALLRSWPPYALVALGLLGLLLVQAAYRTGGVGGPLAALSLLEPAASVLLAAVVIGAPLPSGPVPVVGALVAAVGVVLLSGTPTDPGAPPPPG